MQLNDEKLFSSIDRQNMLALIDNTPLQFLQGWELGLSLSLPVCGNLESILFTGVGGAAAAGELVNALLYSRCSIPCIVHRDYSLPAWANDDKTLVIAISHSGESEETISSLQKAMERKCRILAITTGGHLREMAACNGIAACIYEHNGPSRTALALVFGLILAILCQLGVGEITESIFESALQAMQQQQSCLKADISVARNPAKRIAGQFMERWITLFAAEHLAPLARRWKNQINELAKALASYEIIPEADYNALMSYCYPAEEMTHGMLFFLESQLYHPQNRARLEVTRRTLMLEGMNSDLYQVPGDSHLAQQCCALHFGDYLAYYLAILYEIDPTPVDMLEVLKTEILH